MGLLFVPYYFSSSFAGVSAGAFFAAGFLTCFISPDTSTRIWLDFFANGNARPRDAGLKRRRRGPAVTLKVLIVNVFASRPWLLVAFAAAD